MAFAPGSVCTRRRAFPSDDGATLFGGGGVTTPGVAALFGVAARGDLPARPALLAGGADVRPSALSRAFCCANGTCADLEDPGPRSARLLGACAFGFAGLPAALSMVWLALGLPPCRRPLSRCCNPICAGFDVV